MAEVAAMEVTAGLLLNVYCTSGFEPVETAFESSFSTNADVISGRDSEKCLRRTPKTGHGWTPENRPMR
jgi:hypothetical protein